MSPRRLLPLALLLSACASEPPPPAPQPEAPRAYVATTTPAPAPGAPAGRKPHQVQFTVNRADLSSEVLPLFEQQVGIRITWLGDSRPVTLRLTQPMNWEDALSLVC